MSIGQVLSNDGDWDWNRLEDLLTPFALLHSSNIRPPNPDGEDDVCYWKDSKNGAASTSSAYNK